MLLWIRAFFSCFEWRKLFGWVTPSHWKTECGVLHGHSTENLPFLEFGGTDSCYVCDRMSFSVCEEVGWGVNNGWKCRSQRLWKILNENESKKEGLLGWPGSIMFSELKGNKTQWRKSLSLATGGLGVLVWCTCVFQPLHNNMYLFI